MQTFRIVLGSLWTSIRAVRVWSTFWLALTIAALFVVWPVWRANDAALSQHPGARLALDQALDADLARTDPAATPGLLGALAFALVAGAFLSGGVLRTVGRPERPFRYTEFLAESGRFFLRNARVLALGVFGALLVGWGVDVLDTWLREDVLYARDPGEVAVPVVDVRWVHVLAALDLAWGFLFCGIVFAAKVAMAHLALTDRRSAFVAWFVSLARLARRPLRGVLCVALLVVLWLGVHHAIGYAIALLETRSELWIGLVAGQVGAVFGVCVVVASALTARRFLEVDRVAEPDLRNEEMV